jgi:hypothetical protein
LCPPTATPMTINTTSVPIAPSKIFFIALLSLDEAGSRKEDRHCAYVGKARDASLRR